MRAPAGSLCKAVARYFCARPLGPFAKQECAFLRAPAGSFCKAEARFLCPAGRLSSPFVRRPRASIHRPQRPALPSLCPPPRTPAFPWSWLRFLGPCMPPLHARPLSSSSCPVRTRPLSLPFSPFPPPGPAIIRSSIPGARPLFHSVRPAAAPVSPCAAAPFPSLFTIPRASFAKKRCPRRRSDTAGVRPRLPCLRRSLLRSAARGKGRGWRRNGRCRA